MTEHEPGFATRAIHGAVTPPIDQAVPSAPIYQTATYRFDTSDEYAETIAFRRAGYTYTRGYGNPTVEAFEAQIAGLEGTEAAFGFASGMAAIHTVVTSVVGAGDLDDAEAVRGMTEDLMATLTSMAVDLRDRYPKRWG